ncbi:ketoacyl-synt-domain-containing protein [Sesbania bispinosa]|nr:ketoacyl-synt-domain-containing protein [Sesbania bispinosa]
MLKFFNWLEQEAKATYVIATTFQESLLRIVREKNILIFDTDEVNKLFVVILEKFKAIIGYSLDGSSMVLFRRIGGRVVRGVFATESKVFHLIDGRCEAPPDLDNHQLFSNNVINYAIFGMAKDLDMHIDSQLHVEAVKFSRKFEYWERSRDVEPQDSYKSRSLLFYFHHNQKLLRLKKLNLE